ncbi:type II toxin-antitoxin system HicB family antitoxin [Dongia soli]|uniref:Type II toxin-antitoxin system HicB family antitoxin n=1 Tax=Dongia soli TaxID=600628 RepID=A0ABU5E8U0_9PROT|nr:type II toxin-antitoxin system HicB family antitoxin [Dongia soli]MDY0882337.1 type II toxin-antitoxin system HicB family antitoxin [Dongia soli]
MLDYYVALIHKEAGSDYGVMFPDFPGCISVGATYEEAISMGTEALALHVAGMIADGAAVPAPRSLEAIKAAGEDWIDWENAIVTVIPLLPIAQGKPQATNLSLDTGLVEAVDQYAQRAGLTRSAAFTEGARLLMQTRPAGKVDLPVRNKKSAKRAN